MIEETLERLSKSIDQLTLTIIDVTKYVKQESVKVTVEEPTERTATEVVESMPEPVEPKPKRVAKKKEEPKEEAEAVAVEEKPQAPTVTLEMIQTAAKDLITIMKGESAKAKQIIMSFGIEKISQLTDAQLRPAFDALTTAIKENKK